MPQAGLRLLGELPRGSELTNQPPVLMGQVKAWEVGGVCQGRMREAESWGTGRLRWQLPQAFARAGRQSQGEAKLQPEEKARVSIRCKGQVGLELKQRGQGPRASRGRQEGSQH